jgi:hypothetical protein
MCLFDFLHNFHLKFVSTPEESSKLFSQIDYVFLSNFNKLALSRQNPSESAMQSFRLIHLDTETDRQTGTTKLIIV